MEYKKWFEQAEEDLDSAEKNIGIGKFYVSAFMSQQSVEKALKALIMKKDDSLFKVHDLFILGKKAGVSDNLLDKCEKLSKVYIESRYGIVGDIPSKKFEKSDADKFLEIAKEVLEWVKKKI